MSVEVSAKAEASRRIQPTAARSANGKWLRNAPASFEVAACNLVAAQRSDSALQVLAAGVAAITPATGGALVVASVAPALLAAILGFIAAGRLGLQVLPGLGLLDAL